MKKNRAGEKINDRVKYLDVPIKSENDKKQYKVIELPNGLTALLISESKCSTTYKISNDEDIQVEKLAACGLCIDVGSFSDPIEVQGTAHLLEHVIQLASKKYPECAGYERFIRSKRGTIHAETGRERTRYLFEIQPSCLLPALDRIAHFLAAPSIDSESLLRECEAVDNEFLLESSSNSDKSKHLFRVILHEVHPASKFSCGNMITLRNNISGDTLRSTLMEFWKRHYSAHRMKFVVQATLSLDQLESYVTNCFANVPVNNLSPDDFTRHSSLNSVNTNKFKKIYRISAKTCELDVKWILAPVKYSYKTKPLNYISRLINREGKGSLTHYLRDNELCSRLSTNQELFTIYSTFTLRLVLCDENTPIKNVLDTVFSYINMLRREGLQETLFNEMRQNAENKLNFAEDIPAAANVQSLCYDMHIYPPTYYLLGDRLYFKYDPECIKNVLDCLTPDNAIIVHANKKFNEEEFDKIEQWYRIKYSVDEIPEDWITSWKEYNLKNVFFMPESNRFVATDFSLIKLPKHIPEYPINIKNDGKIRIWYKADSRYRLPHCYVYVRLISGLIINSLDRYVMMRLFEILLHELLLEDLYDATLSGLVYDVSANVDGLLIKINGFNQNVPMALNIIVKHIAEFNVLITLKLFNLAKYQLSDYYSNLLYDPEALASEILAKTIEWNYWMSNEKNAALLTINFDEFLNFSKRMTNNVQIECLVQGNVTQNETMKMICESIATLKLSEPSKNTILQEKMHHLPIGEICCRIKNLNCSDVNSVIKNFYQTDVNYSKFSLPIFKEFLEFLIEEPLFYQLRTVEQLGYDVSFAGSAGGFIISVQSPTIKFTTLYVNSRIESFTQQFVIDALSRMTEEEFSVKKRYFVQSRVIGDTSLRNEVDRNWFAISCKIPFFDERPERISAINHLTISELRQWFADHVVVGGKEFRKLSVQIEGSTDR